MTIKWLGIILRFCKKDGFTETIGISPGSGQAPDIRLINGIPTLFLKIGTAVAFQNPSSFIAERLS